MLKLSVLSTEKKDLIAYIIGNFRLLEFKIIYNLHTFQKCFLFVTLGASVEHSTLSLHLQCWYFIRALGLVLISLLIQLLAEEAWKEAE